MSHSVLGSVTLAYQPVWNQGRKRCGIRLLVDADHHAEVHLQGLVQTIADMWPGAADRLLVSADSPALLQDLLQHKATQGMGFEIQDHWLGDRQLATQLQKAKAHGVRLIWHGIPGQAPAADVQGWFHNVLRSLSPQEALSALYASRHPQAAVPQSPRAALHSPAMEHSLFEDLASPALVSHALDHQGAAGVVGWPTDEVLHSYHCKPIQPARHLVLELLRVIDADASMDAIEHHMGNDPLLAYRFMRYANSAGLGLHRDIENLREALMAIGYATLRTWLAEQLPHTSTDANLDPIRASIVLRARIMEQLANAGVGDSLRREVFMCGIFSQLDLLLGEPLPTLLHRLPLPARVSAAVLHRSGPYAAWIDVAAALESGSTRTIRTVCETHAMAPQDVNRALLQALAAG